MVECEYQVNKTLDVQKVRDWFLSLIEFFNICREFDDVIHDPIFPDIIGQIELAYPEETEDEWLILAKYEHSKFRIKCSKQIWSCYLTARSQSIKRRKWREELTQPTRPSSCPPLSQYEFSVLR